MKFNLPVGFEAFHKDAVINFQLNRWYSVGLARYEDLIDIGQKANTINEVKLELIKKAEISQAQGRLVESATYYRGAELFTYPEDLEKKALYEKCTTLYRKAYEGESIEMHKIPYEDGILNVMKIIPKSASKGIILMHGGYDSLIEEFYPVALLAVERGYTIYNFEGPGQGAPLHEHDMKMTHQWEKPVKAILDYFSLDNVILIGVSLGGYLAARAAAYEPRIKQVVLWDIIYDFYGAIVSKKPLFSRIATNLLMKLKRSRTINSLEKKVRENSLFADWLLAYGYYVFGVDNLYDYMIFQKKFSTVDISHLIKQDVLLLAGADDIYTIYYEKQKNALNNAKSVEGRIFMRDEHASHHCQVGNLKLAMEYVVDWLDKKHKH